MTKTANLVMSEHAVKALAFIQEYRYLTVNQVAVITGLKPKSSSELLLRLERQKLLSHFGNVGQRGYGKTPKVYYLTKRGNSILCEELEARNLPAESYRPIKVSTRWSQHMYHRIATIDVLMSLERACIDRDNYRLATTLTEYRREQIDKQLVGETTDYVELPAEPENRLVPDAGFVLENASTKQRALFLIEVDLATETISTNKADAVTKSFKHKIEQYDRYLLSKRFQQRYRQYGEFNYFVLLIITSRAGRAHNIRFALASLPENLHQYYRVSTLDEVRDNFFHAAWQGRSVADSNRYQLIREGIEQ